MLPGRSRQFFPKPFEHRQAIARRIGASVKHLRIETRELTCFFGDYSKAFVERVGKLQRSFFRPSRSTAFEGPGFKGVKRIAYELLGRSATGLAGVKRI